LLALTAAGRRSACWWPPPGGPGGGHAASGGGTSSSSGAGGSGLSDGAASGSSGEAGAATGGGTTATGGSAGQGGAACGDPWATCGASDACAINLDFDSKHCGGCGHSCWVGFDQGICAKGSCAEQLSPEIVRTLARDASHVYWAEDDPAAADTYVIKRAPAAGGPAEMVAQTPEIGALASPPLALAVDASNVYFTEPTSTGTRIHKVPKAGGTPPSLVAEDTAGDNAYRQAIFSDGTRVHWLGDNGIYRAPVAGGAAELWFKYACLVRLMLDGTKAVFSCGDSIMLRDLAQPPSADYQPDLAIIANDLNHIAADATHFYWASPTKISRVPKSGGASTVIANAGPIGLDVDASWLWFSAEDGATGNHAVMRVDKTGGAAPEPVAGDMWFTATTALVLVDDRVFVENWGEGFWGFQK
jgi:hypothetical protein